MISEPVIVFTHAKKKKAHPLFPVFWLVRTEHMTSQYTTYGAADRSTSHRYRPSDRIGFNSVQSSTVSWVSSMYVAQQKLGSASRWSTRGEHRHQLPCDSPTSDQERDRSTQFCRSFLEETHTAMALLRAEALFDFEPTAPVELELKVSTFLCRSLSES